MEQRRIDGSRQRIGLTQRRREEMLLFRRRSMAVTGNDDSAAGERALRRPSRVSSSRRPAKWYGGWLCKAVEMD
jgi:hypothetical protein